MLLENLIPNTLNSERLGDRPKSGIDPIITISSYDHLVSRGHPRRLDVKNRNWFLQAPKALETLVQNLNTGTETKQHFFFNKGTGVTTKTLVPHWCGRTITFSFQLSPTELENKLTSTRHHTDSQETQRPHGCSMPRVGRDGTRTVTLTSLTDVDSFRSTATPTSTALDDGPDFDHGCLILYFFRPGTY